MAANSASGGNDWFTGGNSYELTRGLMSLPYRFSSFEQIVIAHNLFQLCTLGKLDFVTNVWLQGKLYNILNIPLAIMGVLSPHLHTFDGSALPTIDMKGIFSAHMSE